MTEIILASASRIRGELLRNAGLNITVDPADVDERAIEEPLLKSGFPPADIAEVYGLEGGHEMHGELALDQLGPMRPAMALSRYATSISGLYCGSAGIHPGGGLSGRPGLLSARAAH